MGPNEWSSVSNSGSWSIPSGSYPWSKNRIRILPTKKPVPDPPLGKQPWSGSWFDLFLNMDQDPTFSQKTDPDPTFFYIRIRIRPFHKTDPAKSPYLCRVYKHRIEKPSFLFWPWECAPLCKYFYPLDQCFGSGVKYDNIWLWFVQFASRTGISLKCISYKICWKKNFLFRQFCLI